MTELADGVVRLRPWMDGDLALLDRAVADDYVATILHLPVPLKREAAAAWLRTRPRTDLAIEVDGEAAGGAGIASRHVPGLAELGYWIVPGRRGAGIATRAALLLSRWALTEGGVERLQAVVEPWNTASQRVLEKAGFQREGLMRGYGAYRGERQDVYLYALLRDDLA